MTRRTLRTTVHSILVHGRVYDNLFIHLLMYMTDHISPVLPIKNLVNQDSKPTTPHKLATITKTSVSNLQILFCPYVVQKAAVNVDTKTLNMHHQSQFVLWYLCWNSTTPKRVPHLRTDYTENSFLT